MKPFFILLIFTSCATASRHTYPQEANQPVSHIMRLIDSIDTNPSKYVVTLTTPDTTIHGKLRQYAHRFEKFERMGNDSLGRKRITLHNRLYWRRYCYIVNDKWMKDDFDPKTIDSAKVSGITILTDKPGFWYAHGGCEFLIIIKTK